MALANIIKEVDPPVELTQAEYDALSTAQKNDGTVYFITDGNGAFPIAATVPAEDTSGGTSNVQDELQKKVEWNNVTDSFTTTQSGIAVADASALKTIADNYSLKTDLQNYTYPTAINSGSIDNIRTYGYYFLSGVTGLPEGINGTLRVQASLPPGLIRQIYMRVGTPGTNDNSIYIRQTKDNGSWAQWWRYEGIPSSYNAMRSYGRFPASGWTTSTDTATAFKEIWSSIPIFKDVNNIYVPGSFIFAKSGGYIFCFGCKYQANYGSFIGLKYTGTTEIISVSSGNVTARIL